MTVGVPVIRPVVEPMLNPLGRLLASKEVGSFVAVI